jgi:molybdopterin-biosynthesis enzyme MoeA-like protein
MNGGVGPMDDATKQAIRELFGEVSQAFQEAEQSLIADYVASIQAEQAAVREMHEKRDGWQSRLDELLAQA